MASKWLISVVFNVMVVIVMMIVVYHSVLSWMGIHYFLHQTDKLISIDANHAQKILQMHPTRTAATPPKKVPTRTDVDTINHRSVKAMSHYAKDITDYLCLDEKAIIQFQLHQWYQAAHEVFGNVSANIGVSDKDMGFYKETYGALNVHLSRRKNENELGLDSLLYHRIYKNGNDNIRSLLYEYAHYMTHEHNTFLTQQCPADKCAHKNVESFYTSQLRAMNQSTKRHAFTFVREPIVRFVSAVNEIESRAYLEQSKSEQLRLIQPLGTHHRFMEFVDKVLLSGASKFLFRDNERIEMGHIAPMIGTLLFAKSVDRNPLHLYRFEEFKTEWHRLSEDTKLRELKFVFDRRKSRSDWVQHASATDPVNVTKSSLQFLSLAGNEAKRRFGSKLRSMTSHLVLEPNNSLIYIKPLAQKYLRALCRIYLIDYVCINYDLPLECQPLKVEMKKIVQLMKLSTTCTNNLCTSTSQKNFQASKHTTVVS